jgi:hypothetical protein
MKKRKMEMTLGSLTALAGVLLILMASALPVESQQELRAQVTVESKDIPEGQEATIIVSVDAVPGGGLASYQGSMSFDSGVISILRVEFPENCPVRAYNVQNGILRFAATKCLRADEQGITQGEIFRILVRAVGQPGSCATLNPRFEIFHSPAIALIPHTVVAGVICSVSAVNQVPTADFDYSPAFPSTRDTIQFTDRSRDPDGQLTAWLWEFGDGATADRQTPSHKYAQSGTYTIKLTVTDNRGATASITKRLYIFQAPAPNAIAVINFPNPASTQTRFLYFLPEGTTRATLLVFDLTGRPALITDLAITDRVLVWNLRDENGNDLPNGPYFYLARAETPSGVVSSRVEVLVIQR